ncbi:MAG: hypothetical protein ACPGCY_02625 [Henriciella sp.]
MSDIRNRVKDRFPTILVSLLSILQATAFSLLWTHDIDTIRPDAFSPGMLASLWQIAATVLLLIIIWIVYCVNIMRFVWLPTLLDSIFPFAIGLTEFMMIEYMNLDRLGWWLLFGALLNLLTAWSAQNTLVKARQDPGNARYFADIQPATWRNFIHDGFSIGAMTALAIYLIIRPDSQIAIWAALIFITAIIATVFNNLNKYWGSAMSAD